MTQRLDSSLYNVQSCNINYIVFIYESPQGGALDFDSFHSNLILAFERLQKRLRSNESTKGHILDVNSKIIINIDKLECTLEGQILKEIKNEKKVSVAYLMRKFKITSQKAIEIMEKHQS